MAKIIKKEDVVVKFDTTERHNVRIEKDGLRVKKGTILSGVGRLLAWDYVKRGIGVLINEDGEICNLKGKAIKDPKEALV